MTAVAQHLEIGGVKLRSHELKRDPNPLQWRRVRHRETGRMGNVDRAWLVNHGRLNGDNGPQASVHWDDLENSWSTERVSLDDVEVLDAPPITVPVFVRKVLYRGHKEQVAEWLAAHQELPGDAVEAGARRYVEFDPNGMSYQRWRVVYCGPPMDQEKVDTLPDQAPGAEKRRSDAHDMAYDA